MANKIQITFAAKGHQGVTAAVKALNKETSKLVNANKLLSGSTEGLTKEQKKLINQLKKVEKNQKKVAKSSNAMSKATMFAKRGFMALGAALVAGTVYSVKQAKEFEKLRTRLTSLYGSVTKGEKAFNAFNQVAATTPFALQNVIEAGASLKAFGMDAEQNIKGVSDLAAFMGLDVVSAANAMGRAFAGGAGAAIILRERGILELVKSFKGIDDLSKLTLPEFREALQEAIEDPTLGIAGSTSALAETFEGAYSNMWDSISRLGAAMGDNLLPTVKAITKAIGAFASGLEGGGSAQEKQLESMQRQQMELRVLQSNLNNTTKGTATYTTTIKRLNKEYPDLVGALGDEGWELNNVNSKIDDYIKNSKDRMDVIRQEIKLEAMKEKLVEVERNRINSTIKFSEALSGVDDVLNKQFATWTENTQGIENYDAIQQHLSDTLKDVKAAQDGFIDGSLNQEGAVKAIQTAMEEFAAGVAISDWDASGLQGFSDDIYNFFEGVLSSANENSLIMNMLGMGGKIEFLGGMDMSQAGVVTEIMTAMDDLGVTFDDLTKEGEDYDKVMALITSRIEEQTEATIKAREKAEGSGLEGGEGGPTLPDPKEMEAYEKANKKFADKIKNLNKDIFTLEDDLKDPFKNQRTSFDDYQQYFKDGKDKIVQMEKDHKAKIEGLADGEVWVGEAESMAEQLEYKKELLAEELEFIRQNEEAKQQIKQEAIDMGFETAAAVSSHLQSELDSQVSSELDALKKSEKYKKASDAEKERMEEELKKKFQKRQVAIFRLEQAQRLASVAMSTADAIMKVQEQYGWPAGIPLAALMAAMGATQAGVILAQKPPKLEKGGLIGGQLHSQGGTMIEAERGEFVMSRRATDAIGLETLNNLNQTGSVGGNVVVNVSGNVMTQDFVEGELADSIKEAVRRGSNFGIN